MVKKKVRFSKCVDYRGGIEQTYISQPKPRVSKNVAFFTFFSFCLLWWANPGRTAIPGRPVERAEQALGISPQNKNQFNIVVAMKPRIRY